MPRSYWCDCGTSELHRHTVDTEVATARGQHIDCSVDATPVSLQCRVGILPRLSAVHAGHHHRLAIDLNDAIQGALWGAALGDALAVPMHWYYTWSMTLEHRREYYHGGFTAMAVKLLEESQRSGQPPNYADLYTGVHPAAQTSHPDSYKYFAKALPLDAVTAGMLGDAAAAWLAPGTHYHANLPPGDNTLTARLMTLVADSVHHHGRFDANAWKEEYHAFVATRGDHNHDTWIDETHRVLQRNLARGAQWHEAGMDDCCLSGLVLSLPLILTYAFDRYEFELAVRCLLQYTHKSEDMIRQCLFWYDMIVKLIGAVTHPQASTHEEETAAVLAIIEALTRTFSHGKLDLPAVDAVADTEEAAFHGAQAVFSVRYVHPLFVTTTAATSRCHTLRACVRACS